jgi:type I restriction enzyme S subunit
MTTVATAQKFFQEFPTYPDYKDSEIDWIGKVPTHWEVKRVKYTSLILIPQRNKPELNFDEGIPWITMDDLTSHSVERSISGYYVSEYEAKKAGSKTLPIGCVITSCVGNFGVASVNTEAVIINQQLQAYLPKK